MWHPALAGLALALAQSQAAPPAATEPETTAPSRQTEPASIFDDLFGGEPERSDASSDARAGRDDLNLATVRAGHHELNAALPIYPVGEGWCAPAGALLDILGVAHERDGDRLVVTLFEPQRHHAIPASRLSASPEGECLAIADAAALTESELAFDRASLTLHVGGAEPVPALAALEREESRKRRAGTAAPAAPDYPQMENPWRWASVPTIDVAMTAGWSNGRATGSTLIEGAGDLLKATALWRTTYSTEGSLRLSGKLSRVDPDGDMLGPLHARRIEAGDIAVPAQPLIAAGSRMRGIVISSAPEWRADIFDMVEISGPLPERWHAELSQETRLLGYVDAPDAAGEYRFADVPLKVGANRFVVDLYGPHGEHERRVVERHVGGEQYAENEASVTFGVAMPVPARDGEGVEQPASAFATVRGGLATWATARFDARQALDGSARAASLGIDASALGGVVGVALARREPGGIAGSAVFARRLGGMSLAARFSDFGAEASAWGGPDDLSLRRSAGADLSGAIALGGRRLAWALGTIHAEGRDGTVRDALRTQASMRLGTVRLDNQLAFDWGATKQSVGSFAVDWSKGTAHVRTQVAYGLLGGFDLRQIGVFADVAAGPWALRANAAYEPGGGALLAVGAARRIGDFDLALDAGWGGRGPRIGASLRFALGRVPGRGLATLPSGASRTAILAPMLATRGGGAVAGGRFMVANTLRKETTQGDGRALIGGIVTGRPQSLALQLSSLEDDRMRPMRSGVDVVARPGQIMAIPVTLVPTGAIEVRLVRRAGDRMDALVGVRVSLTGADGTNVVRETDFDGYALFDGLSYGRYTTSARFSGVSSDEQVELRADARDLAVVMTL